MDHRWDIYRPEIPYVNQFSMNIFASYLFQTDYIFYIHKLGCESVCYYQPYVNDCRSFGNVYMYIYRYVYPVPFIILWWRHRYQTVIGYSGDARENFYVVLQRMQLDNNKNLTLGMIGSWLTNQRA